MKVKVAQSVRCVYSCLQFRILMEMSTNNPSQKSAVLEFFCQIKPMLQIWVVKGYIYRIIFENKQ